MSSLGEGGRRPAAATPPSGRPTRPAAGGRVIWITGLSGAGKTTVAAEVVRVLRRKGDLPVLLDGDELRETLGTRGGFDVDSRRRLAYVYARLCRLLAGQGHTVVCATIALFHDVHVWNRQHLPGYLEVFLDVPRGELERRDAKGVYGPAGDPGEVVGIGLAAELPFAPDVRIANFGETTPRSAAETIVRARPASELEGVAR